MAAMQSNPEPRNGAKFEELLSVMPRIAEAVNGFMSEENQLAALSVLLRAFGLPEPPLSRTKPAEPSLSVVRSLDLNRPEEGGAEEAVPPASTSQPTNARRRNRKKPPLRAKDINLHPEDKQSLREFAAVKSPAGFNEMNAVAVYYLQVVLGLDVIEAGHVLAAYHECGWRVPADPENALMKTASARKWLDTSDMKAIRLTFVGRNVIEHDMPRNAKNSA